IADLALAHAVLAAAGALHEQGALGEPVEKALHRAPLLGTAGIEQRHDMEIAVADVADDRGEQAGPVDVGARLADASGKGRDRHADIGGLHLGAWTQASRRPICVVAGLPELAAVLLALGPGELPSSLFTRELGEGFDLLARGGGAAVKLEKQRWLLGKREMRIGVAGPDLHLVGELDAGERNAPRHGDDGRVAEY